MAPKKGDIINFAACRQEAEAKAKNEPGRKLSKQTPFGVYFCGDEMHICERGEGPEPGWKLLHTFATFEKARRWAASEMDTVVDRIVRVREILSEAETYEEYRGSRPWHY